MIVNVGTGKKSYINELIESIRLGLDYDVLPIEELEGTPGDFKGAVADIKNNSEIYKDLELTNLENGIRKFIEWSNKL